MNAAPSPQLASSEGGPLGAAETRRVSTRRFVESSADQKSHFHLIGESSPGRVDRFSVSFTQFGQVVRAALLVAYLSLGGAHTNAAGENVLRVTASVGTAAVGSTTAPPGTTGTQGAALKDVAVVLPAPLPTGDVRAIPGHISLATLAALALLPAVVIWTALAGYRAYRDDPLRTRRKARRDLQRLLSDMQGRGPTPIELDHWRELSVQLWSVPQAVPAAEELAKHVAPATSPETWRTLWEEAEASLYSPRRTLRSNWASDALGLVRQVPPFPGTPWLPAVRAQWWPAAVIAFAVFVSGIGNVQGADPAAEHHSAQFAEAAKVAQQQLSKHPGDWSAHHNLALASAQQTTWGVAAGHWTAAFLLNPRNDAVLAGARAAVAKTETIDPELRALIMHSGLNRVVACGSVADWQRVTQVSAAGIAIGLSACVVSLYVSAHRRRWWRRAGAAAAFVSVSAAALSLFALHRYGPLAESQAAFVTRSAELRSIPSDIVGKEQTSTLFPGTIVKVHRSFLGWDQISLRGEVAGWVRSDSLVWLYRHRNDQRPATILRP